MIRLVSPSHSFVQFGFEQYEALECGRARIPCLPMANFDDILFQVYIDCDNEAEADSVMAAAIANIKLKIIESGFTSAGAPTVLKDYSASHTFERYRLSETRILLYWNNGLPDFGDYVSCETCFQLVIDFSLLTANNIPTNYLCRICEHCFTSVLEYYCNEDAYGFHYCTASVVNKVRLPLYLTRPQFPEEFSAYYKSDGTRKTTKAVTRKEYEGFTDMFPEAWHEKLTLALSHDNVSIESKNYSGGISKNGSYEIEWPEFMDYLRAPAKFKVFASPYNQRNTNCAICEPYDSESAECGLTIEDLVVNPGTPGGGPFVYSATWTNIGGVPFFSSIEYSLDGGATWATPPNGNLISPAEWAYDLGVSGPMNHQVRITPYCNDDDPGTPATADFIHDDCGVPQNVSFEVVNNGDGTQTITISFDNVATALALTLSYSADGSAFIGNNTGSPNSPRVYTIPVGIYYIKLKTHPGTCEGEIIFANIGVV